MNAEAIPTISIRLDAISHEMITCLGLDGSELGEAIQNGIREEFKNVLLHENNRIKELVRKQIEIVIQKRVEEFFKYGNPGEAFINEKIDAALNDLLDKERE